MKKILFFILANTLFLVLVLLVINQILRKKLKDSLRKLKDEKGKSQELEITLQKTKEMVIQNEKYQLSVLHDMKNLGLPLVAYSELLVMENISFEQMKSIAQKMNQNAGKVIDVFNNILKIHKGKSDLLLPAPTSWNLYDTIEEIHTLLVALYNKKSISFENRIEPKQMIYADCEMIRSVLVNLLTNAIKFTHHGGKIVVYGEKIKENLYQLYVKDSGVGIDEQTKEELFSSAQYISTTGTEGEVGTGLGLALCKDFVNRNGGDIYVENNHDEAGATFSFTVPVHEEVAKVVNLEIKG